MVANGCALSMIDMMEYVITDQSQIQPVFFDPLLELLRKGSGATKAQLKSTSFCLRRLVEHLIKNKPQSFTMQLIAKLFETMTSGRIIEAEYILMIRGIIIRLLQHDISAFAAKPLFLHSLKAINLGNNNSSRVKLGESIESVKMAHIPGD